MSESNSDDESWQSESAGWMADMAEELFQCCRSDWLSEECICEIIERYTFSPDDHNMSNYQFFRMACWNKKSTEAVIQCLLEYFPAAAKNDAADEDGQLPLHYACNSDDVSLGVIQLLIDAAPDSVHREDDSRNMPLHILCANPAFDETKSLQILQLLLTFESVRHANNKGHLPIHIAAMVSKSTENLSVLMKAYPGSVRTADLYDAPPFHYACTFGPVATVEYLFNLYPDAIDQTTSTGMYPIHIAIEGLRVDVVKFLLGCNPAVKFQECRGHSLLTWACLVDYDSNIGDAVEMIEIIYDAQPEFIREVDSCGRLPLHCLCFNKQFDGEAACELLKLFLERYPESIHHAINRGYLAIHLASQVKSPEFCRVLIEASPGSERIADHMDSLPFHLACMGTCVATVEYLYKLYPDAIDHATPIGTYPIHGTIAKITERDIAEQEASVDIVKFLLGCDPRVKLQGDYGTLSLLAWAFRLDYDDDNIGSALEIIKAIYDAYPEAIEFDEMLLFIESSHPQVKEFGYGQMIYTRHSINFRQVETPDGNGQLLLHVAVQNNARLGSIKLLVEKYPPAVQSPDNSGVIPLHLACAHHESATVVQHLVELDTTTLEAVDRENNTALHYACRGAKYETITLLLERYGAISVSKRNAQEKLPLDLLWESNKVVDRESVEYTGSIFQLVKAYPETVMSWM